MKGVLVETVEREGDRKEEERGRGLTAKELALANSHTVFEAFQPLVAGRRDIHKSLTRYMSTRDERWRGSGDVCLGSADCEYHYHMPWYAQMSSLSDSTGEAVNFKSFFDESLLKALL